MINSQYISDILELLAEGDDPGLQAKNQLSFISEKDREYTGSGAFIYFEYSMEAQQYRLEVSDTILNGVKINSPGSYLKADATLFFSDGLINYLEIWCYLGEYPASDLETYTLKQLWYRSDGRSITRS